MNRNACHSRLYSLDFGVVWSDSMLCALSLTTSSVALMASDLRSGAPGGRLLRRRIYLAKAGSCSSRDRCNPGSTSARR